MDPTVVAALFALVSSILIAAFSMRSGKGQLANSASDSFRDDLLERVEQQDQKIARQDEKIERQDARIERLLSENGELKAHIVVLTQWGKWSDQPIPREPPPWRPTVETP